MWDNPDFYEPSEFEKQVEEFKDSLKKSVKAEFLQEMELLRKENAELQDVKKNLNSIHQEHAFKLQDLENQKSTMLRQVRQERFSQLMKDFSLISYRATSKREEMPKCDRCDEKRKIYFKSPMGKPMMEDCICALGRKIYVPEEMIAAEFTVNRDGHKLSVWFERCDKDSDSYRSTTYAERVYEPGTPFDQLPQYWSTFFRDKEECQAYCEWLTQREEG